MAAGAAPPSFVSVVVPISDRGLLLRAVGLVPTATLCEDDILCGKLFTEFFVVFGAEVFGVTEDTFLARNTCKRFSKFRWKDVSASCQSGILDEE